eukprot:scaffold125542_cov17-Prasinocladus_malaysianus.AAC.1
MTLEDSQDESTGKTTSASSKVCKAVGSREALCLIVSSGVNLLTTAKSNRQVRASRTELIDWAVIWSGDGPARVGAGNTHAPSNQYGWGSPGMARFTSSGDYELTIVDICPNHRTRRRARLALPACSKCCSCFFLHVVGFQETKVRSEAQCAMKNLRRYYVRSHGKSPQAHN